MPPLIKSETRSVNRYTDATYLERHKDWHVKDSQLKRAKINPHEEAMKENIVFLDATQEYPVQFSASNTKVEMMGRGLRALGCRVLVINSIIGRATAQGAGSNGVLEYFSFRQPISKYCGWVFNIVPLYRLLRNRRQAGTANVIVTNTHYYPMFVMYVLLGRMTGYRLTFMFDEWHVTGEDRTLAKRLNAGLLNYTFGYFLDGILPISSFLEQKASRFGKKLLRLPVLADYDQLQPLSDSDESYSYFLYCAQAAYLRVILILLDALALYASAGRQEKLVMILSGKNEHFDRVRREIDVRGLGCRVEIRTDIPFDELHQLYREALALMIPLDPESIQDRARFPQKIAEYLAAARPIITAGVGEIPHYFRDKRDVVLATSHSPEAYAEAMLRVAGDPQQAAEIGRRGRCLGERVFDYRTHCRKLCAFFEVL